MKVSAIQEPLTQVEANALVVACYDKDDFSGPVADVNEATGGVLARLRESGELSGEANQLTPILAPAGLHVDQLLVVGLGSRDEVDAGVVFRAMATAAKKLAEKSRPRIVFLPDPSWDDDMVEAGVCASLVGCVGQDLYRKEKKLNPFETVVWPGLDEALLERGSILAGGMRRARELVNRPSSEIYPESFAELAGKIAKEVGLEIEVWDQARLEQEGCGALLGVAQGSARPPRLIWVTYRGGADDEPPLALVGKGVTFDSGGLSLKSTEHMKSMKCDMAGAATVLAAVETIAKLKLPVNVIGLAGLVENMVSGNSYKLGDVLKARSGKTIEVLNTDAEGRLVLADVLDVAAEQQPCAIIDVATLTGACMIALGTQVAGLMTNNQELCDRVAASARACGEPVWQLPMYPEYSEQIAGDVADIKNVGERYGGAITAAKFLEEFVKDAPWVHIDVAGPAFLDKPKPWTDAGASGALVRTLVQVARQLAAGRQKKG